VCLSPQPISLAGGFMGKWERKEHAFTQRVQVLTCDEDVSSMRWCVLSGTNGVTGAGDYKDLAFSLPDQLRKVC
jgi:hypothetical protein